MKVSGRKVQFLECVQDAVVVEILGEISGEILGEISGITTGIQEEEEDFLPITETSLETILETISIATVRHVIKGIIIDLLHPLLPHHGFKYSINHLLQINHLIQ
jgi:hypothetical protein